MGVTDAEIWVAEDGARLASLATGLRAAGHRVGWPRVDGRPAPVSAGGWRAVVIDAAPTTPQSLVSLIEALHSRREGHPGLVAVLVADDEAGAHWLAEGADEYATSVEALLARLHARLQRAAPTQVASGAISLRAAAELALGEIERTLGSTEVEVVVRSQGELRGFRRLAGLLVEAPPTDPAVLDAVLAGPGIRVFTPGAELPAAIAGMLEGVAALVSLTVAHGGAPFAAAIARCGRLPDTGALSALNALAPGLTRALRGTVSAEEAFQGRYRELLESNRRLRELNHAKDEFLAVCAHDLRSPLTALTSHAQLLADGARGELPGPACAAVDAVLRQARRMGELIHSLLAERALETGTLELKREPVDPAVLLSECMEESLPAAGEKGVALVCDGLEHGAATIDADPARLREAIGNLLSNAIKYTPTGGRVELTLALEPEGAAISIRDNGPGIAPDELPTLFDRYRRGRSGRAQYGGVGLGLSWAREVVRLHGGTIGVQSAVGAGTRFTIRLPSGPASLEVTSSERPRVLVVEDDLDVREVMVELLRERFDVLAAGNGEDGVRVAKSERPDVVLMDLFMPQLDGFAALEDLRRDPRTVETPVIFLSGSSDEQVKLRVLDLGAADYLVKPFSPRELVARVEKALKSTNQKRAIQALAQVDALTGLPNYGAFRNRLDEEMKRAARYQHPLAAVMVDLDRLKQLNDIHGHEVGNRAIVALADHLRSNLRTSDFAARFGGDEFVVLLPHTRPEEAAIFAERVRAGLAQLRVATPQGPVQLQASFGVAALPTSGTASPEEALRGADAALYAAKRGGRDRVCVGGNDPAAAGGAQA